MIAVAIDTLKVNNRFKSKGFTEEQAAVLTETVQEAVSVASNAIDVSDMDTFATKKDLESAVNVLRGEIRETELRMTVKIGTMMAAAVGLIVALIKLL